MDAKKIITTIKRIPMPDIRREELYLVLKLVTIIAATHLANKIDKTNKGDIIDILK